MGTDDDRNTADREATETAVSRILAMAGIDSSAFTTGEIECSGPLGGGSDRQASKTSSTRTGADPERSDEVLDAVLAGFDITSPVTDQQITATDEAPGREVSFFADIDGVEVSVLVRITVSGEIRVTAETFC